MGSRNSDCWQKLTGLSNTHDHDCNIKLSPVSISQPLPHGPGLKCFYKILIYYGVDSWRKRERADLNLTRFLCRETKILISGYYNNIITSLLYTAGAQQYTVSFSRLFSTIFEPLCRYYASRYNKNNTYT